MKQTERFDHPKKCPNGHIQISWYSEETDIHCWLCDKAYPISECSHSQGDNVGKKDPTFSNNFHTPSKDAPMNGIEEILRNRGIKKIFSAEIKVRSILFGGKQNNLHTIN